VLAQLNLKVLNSQGVEDIRLEGEVAPEISSYIFFHLTGCAYLRDRHLYDLRKLCFIDLEHTRRLVIPNVLTLDNKRMVIFGRCRFGDI